MSKVNLSEKFNAINDYWNPRIAGRLNGQLVKLVKFKGEFVMHKHENEDEMFLVVAGSFQMKYDNYTETINEGEFVIIPKGINHMPIAENEVSVMMFEPESTLNTGNAESDYKKERLDEI